jgi:hypothetical protein
MTMLGTCERCLGFVPPAADSCPCCLAPAAPAAGRAGRVTRIGRRILAVAGGALVAVTLMACYGGPAQMRGAPAAPCPAGTADIDGDGSCTPADCDDNNASIRPGADDPMGDAADQNCDGVDGVKPAPAAQPPPGPAPPADPAPPPP